MTERSTSLKEACRMHTQVSRSEGWGYRRVLAVGAATSLALLAGCSNSSSSGTPSASGGAKTLTGACAQLVGLDLDVGDPAHVVDRDMEEVVAGATRAGRPADRTRDPVATAGGNSADLLNVDVEELTRALADVPDRDGRRAVEIRQAGQAVTSEDLADRRAGHADDGRQTVGAIAMLVARGEDRLDLGPR